jgi:hypothetical protein
MIQGPLRPLSALLGPLAVLFSQGLPAQEKALAPDRQRGAEAVLEEQAKAWLHQLASEEFAGRATGTKGFELAAEFVAAHFEQLGLEPMGDDGTWYQQVPWGSTEVDAENTHVTFRVGDKSHTVPAANLAGRVTLSTSASGEVVLVTSTDGLEDADLTGKVVLFAGSTGRDRFQAMRALAGKQTAALLFVSDEAPRGGLTGRSGARSGNRALLGGRRMPGAISFGGEDLTQLLAMCGKPGAMADKGLIALGAQADVVIAVHEKSAPAYNVVGVLRGTDRSLKDEYVMIGSHLDHIGVRNGKICPGADDDGSGTTGVMAVAQMFANNDTKPRRSILFACFCGEENGLVGSRYFAENPPVPLSSLVAELQMDMIGRDEEDSYDGSRHVNIGETAEDNKNVIHLVGTQKLAPSLHDLCLSKNEIAGFDIEYDQEGLFSRSDHANFARMGVPIAFFFTGIHKDYHQPTDTPDKINYPKLMRICRYVYDIAFDLAQDDSRPHIDPELWNDYRGKGAADPAAPMMDK